MQCSKTTNNVLNSVNIKYLYRVSQLSKFSIRNHSKQRSFPSLDRRSFASLSGSLVGRILHHEWVVHGKVVSSISSSHEKLQTVIFLHGLLGNGKNLRSPAKRLTEQHPNLRALLLDLRGHGQSSSKYQCSNNSINDEHTIKNCALDIVETAKHLNLTGQSQSPIGIVGHSFGGRCALQYLSHVQKNSDSTSNGHSDLIPPKYTWLLDTVPGAAHSSVSNVIQALRNLDLSRIKNKQDLVKILTTEEKIDKSIAQWMTTNLKRAQNSNSNDRDSANEFEFMFDLDVAIGVLDDFPKQDFMQVVNDCTTPSTDSGNIYHDDDDRVYLVMGGKNKAWTNNIVSDLKSLEVSQKMELVMLPKAGHWVHVDDLDGLMDVMNSCFEKL